MRTPNYISEFRLKLRLALFLLLCQFQIPIQAFEISVPWPLTTSEITFYVDIPGVLQDGQSYVDLFNTAGNLWEQRAGYVAFSTVEEVVTHCRADSNSTGSLNFVNSVFFFIDDFCNYQTSALGITLPLIATPANQEFSIQEVDIAFNGALNWNSATFSNTATHELGHALGLGHSSVPNSMMFPYSHSRREISVDDLCGLSVIYSTPEVCPIYLAGSRTLSGNSTDALFFGGATANEGYSFQSAFNLTSSVQIYASFVPDLNHFGLNGYLHAIIQTADGALYAKRTDGSFTAFNPADSATIPPAEILTLGIAEDMLILGQYDEMWSEFFDLFQSQTKVTGEAFGLGGQSIQIYIGYSLELVPGELFFSQNPIIVSWENH